MKDVLTLLNEMRRPGLLLSAARHGAPHYRRDQHLAPHLGYGRIPGHGEALMRLMELESDMEARRKSGDNTYSVVRHVDLLIAIMGEAQMLRSAR